MKIEHIAMYANDSEVIKDFFVQYFNAACNEGYHNKTTDFRSYFLKFDDCARLEIMKKPEMEDGVKMLSAVLVIYISSRPRKSWMPSSHVLLRRGCPRRKHRTEWVSHLILWYQA